MNFGDREMDRLVDEIAKASKASGSLYADHKTVVHGVEERLQRDGLPVEVKAEIIRRIAELETVRYWNRRKPRPGPQAAFYHPEMWLPLGDGKKVQFCDAGTADLITYGRIIEKNRQRIVDAAKLTSDYLDTRIEALKKNPGKTLDWVERNVFGWAPGDEPVISEPDDIDEP